MAKRLNYTIGVDADTSKLESQLNKAYESLSKIGNSQQITANLQKASSSALELANNLSKAINQNTGKLDLSVFNDNLKRSGQTLNSYYDQLVQLGPAGQDAFLQVASAVVQAELPIKRTSKLLDSLWVTMKNTMRWQLTSSALHGFTGALEQAYGYAKSLDSSLNNIRIVSNKSADDMARFAEQANKAAKALSTTTTDYTDASLIYYQQGLTDQEVLDRTETTIKMANVAGTTAETASQQLTAVWNNFYDGSKSLEYYADVMVKLGAVTASSSDEISEGIEKFAAVANTVGLSYDYAATALATVTAQTRESASVVGTAFRTLFSRIQGLQQGETLDDGTTLNKYSEALAKVGVDIKDTSGDLKDMDEILNELGDRWSTLAQDQKIALAETVAGVRQWTQLIALMDNWDFFQENLAIAQGSSGALEQQAKIYAESWEAARDRTKAAAEDIYDSLINPNFYIEVDNLITPILSGTAEIIDSLGGLKGVLLVAASAMTTLYGDKMAEGIRDMAHNIGIMTGYEQIKARMLQQEGASLTDEIAGMDTKYQLESKMMNLRHQANVESDYLNTHQKQLLQADIDDLEVLRQKTNELLKQKEASENLVRSRVNAVSSRVVAGAANLSSQTASTPKESKYVSKIFSNYQAGGKQITQQKTAVAALTQEYKKVSEQVSRVNVVMGAFEQNGKKLGKTRQDVKAMGEDFKRTAENVGLFNTKLSKTEHLEKMEKASANLTAKLTLLRNEIEARGGDISFLDELDFDIQDLIKNLAAAGVSEEDFANKLNKISTAIEKQGYRIETTADKIVRFGQVVGQGVMALQAVGNLGRVFSDEDMSAGDRLIAIFTSLSMILPLVGNATKGLTAALKAQNIASTVAAVLAKEKKLSDIDNIVLRTVVANIIKKQTTATNGQIAALGAEAVAQDIVNSSLLAFLGYAALAVVAIAAIGVAIYACVKAHNKEADAAKHEAEAAIKAAEETRKESEAIESLYKEYIALRAANDKSTQGKESLRQKTKELCEALGIENATLDILQGNWNALNREIAEANKTTATDALENTKKNINRQQKSMLENNSIWGSYLDYATGDADSAYQILFDTGFSNWDEEEIEEYLIKALEGTGYYKKGNDILSGFSVFVSNSEQFIDLYERLSTAYQEITSNNDDFYGIRQESEVYTSLGKWLDKLAPEYEKLAQLRKDQITYAQQLAQAETALANQDLANVKTMDEYNQIKTDYITRLREIFEAQDLVPDNVEDVDQYFESLASSYLSGYENLEKLENEAQIFESIIKKIGEDNREYLQSLIDQGYDINILGRINWELVTSNGGSLEDKVELAYQTAKAKLDAENFETTIPVVTNVLTQLSNGEEPTSDEELTTIKALEEEYPRLGEIRDRTSAQYIQALRDIREGMENAVSTQKMAELNEAWNELKYEVKDAGKVVTNTRNELVKLYGKNADISLHLNADDKDFAEAMAKIMDADYSVQVAIEADLESDINDVISHAQAIEEATSLIQDGFTVAYNNVEALSKVFPGILAGYTITKDGMIQLNSEIAQSAIGLAQTQMASEKEAAKQNILDYQKVLLAKAAAMRTIAEGLQSLTETSEDNADAQAKIEQGVTDYKSACADEQNLISSGLAESEIDDSDQVMGANENAAGTSANNWADAYDSMARNSSQWARIAIANANRVAEAMKGAKEGKIVTPPEVATGGIFSSYSGGFETNEYQNTYESRGTDNVSWSDYYEQGDYQKAYEAAIKQAESYERSAAELTDYLAKLDGAEANIANLVNSVGKSNSTKSGGSKNKTYDEEDLKTLEDVEDRYHEINRQIERQDDLLDDLSNATDRAWGIDAIKGYEDEIAALEKQQENYNAKLLEAQGYLKNDAGLVKQYFADANIAANGEISNYEDLLKENLALYNAAVMRYNQAVAGKELSEEEYNALKTQLEIEKALFEARQKALEQYESTLDVIRDTTDKIQKNARSIADKKLEEIKFKMEIVLDVKSMKDAVRGLSKEIAEMFGDALTHGLESAKLSAEGAQAEAALLPSYQEEWNSLKALYESTTDDADRRAIMGEIQSLQGNIVDSAKAIAEWANSIEDIVPDAVDAASERFAAFTDQLEHNTSILDTIKELYTLQGVTYKTAEGFNRLQKNSQEKLNAQLASAKLQRGWYEQAAQRLEEAQAKLDSLGGDETDLRYDAYKKARDAYLEEFNEAQEAYLSSAKEAMETAQDMYLQQIEKAVYEFGQAVSNGVGLDLLQDKYDHYIEQNERYFDKVNEAYQVSAWYNKLQQDIDNTTNSAHKERLKALQEEINQRREGNKLSQYDLDILNAKYQVLQAQMALEDAQNAKNKIQLVRDSQGNWNYQYTADQDQIANAQQNLLDAENDWYNIAKQQVTDVTGEIISTWQECQDKIKDIYSDMTLTDEERANKAAEIYQYYSEKVKYLEEEKQNAISDMTEAGNKNLIDNAIITGDTITDLTGVTAEEIKQVVENYTGNITDLLLANNEQLEEIFGDNTKFIDLFDNTYAKDLANMTQNATNFESELRKLLDQAQADFDNYKEKVQNVASETGTTLDDLAQETDKVSDATEQLRDKGLEATDSLWDMIDAAQNASDSYLDLADSIWEAVQALQDLAAAQADFVASQSTSSHSNSKKGYDPNTDYSGVIMDGIANGWLEYGSDEYKELVRQRENKIDDMGLKEDQYGTRGDAADERYKNSSSVGQYNDFETWKKKMHELGVPGYATGGYTGIFDDEKLAFLHQKELVLNQTDTENILAAVRMVRDFGADFFNSIEKVLDSNAIAAMAFMGQKLNPIVTMPVQDSIEQIVHIDKVEFPNVTNRTEIEEAFVSLTNDAAQWARRKS